MSFDRILIFRVGHLGDTVIALPALWAVRRSFPKARITLLTNIDLQNPQYISPADVLPPAGLIDDVMAYPKQTGALKKTREFIELARGLRREQFDLVIYLRPRVRSERQIERDSAFFLLAGIRHVAGIDFLRVNRLGPPEGFPKPIVEGESEFLSRLIEDMGVTRGPIETELLLSDDEMSAADRCLDALTGNFPDKLIAIAPGAKWEFKCWPEERYLEVVTELIARTPCFPIVFGGPEDRERGEHLIQSWGRGLNVAGLLRVRESAALLGKCKLYLGNDTGTMHLAAAVGVPCVAIFTSMDYIGRWDPLGSGHRIFRSASLCEGCMDLKLPKPHTCTDSIGVDEVLQSALEILNRT